MKWLTAALLSALLVILVATAAFLPEFIVKNDYDDWPYFKEIERISFSGGSIIVREIRQSPTDKSYIAISIEADLGSEGNITAYVKSRTDALNELLNTVDADALIEAIITFKAPMNPEDFASLCKTTFEKVGEYAISLTNEATDERQTEIVWFPRPQETEFVQNLTSIKQGYRLEGIVAFECYISVESTRSLQSNPRVLLIDPLEDAQMLEVKKAYESKGFYVQLERPFSEEVWKQYSQATAQVDSPLVDSDKPVSSVNGGFEDYSVNNFFYPEPAHGASSVEEINAVTCNVPADYPTIQKAIDAVPKNRYGIINISKGVYTLNWNPITPRSNITLVGAGIDQTIIRNSAAKTRYAESPRTPIMLSIADLDNFELRDMTLNMSCTPDNLGWNLVDLRGGTNTNITISNVKATDATGAAFHLCTANDIIVQHCVIDSVWTGIRWYGNNSIIKQNRITNTGGDAIFPASYNADGYHVENAYITDNYIENATDTGIDITSQAAAGAHCNVTAVNNTLVNAHFRISFSRNITLSGNTIKNELLPNAKIGVSVDGGAGKCHNIIVEGNTISTYGEYALGFQGVYDCKATNNILTVHRNAKLTQSGIEAGIRGSALIENNMIAGGNYSLSFGGWELGDETTMTIRNNTMVDFWTAGIWDDNKPQNVVLVENNTILDTYVPARSKYGILKQNPDKNWEIRYNRIFPASVSLVNCTFHDNIHE